MLKLISMAAAAVALWSGTVGAMAQDNVLNDYPTEARADYVFGCMQVNGQTQDALRRCACSIDVIATIIPYARYEEASTYMSMGLQLGEKGVLFRTSAASKAAISDLKRAQAEGEIRCF